MTISQSNCSNRTNDTGVGKPFPPDEIDMWRYCQVARVRSVFEPEKFCALAGQSDRLLPAVKVGGTGTITGLANLYPRARMELFNLSMGDKPQEAEKAQIELAAVEWGFTKGGINDTKWVVAKYLGYPEASCYARRPCPKYDDVKNQGWIMEIMRSLETKEKSLAKIAKL